MRNYHHPSGLLGPGSAFSAKPKKKHKVLLGWGQVCRSICLNSGQSSFRSCETRYPSCVNLRLECREGTYRDGPKKKGNLPGHRHLRTTETALPRVVAHGFLEYPTMWGCSPCTKQGLGFALQRWLCFALNLFSMRMRLDRCCACVRIVCRFDNPLQRLALHHRSKMVKRKRYEKETYDLGQGRLQHRTSTMI